jgi:YfiH family protein
MNFHFDKSLIAVTSDRSVDFTPTDFDAPLTVAQQNYLFKQTGQKIPHVYWRKQVHGDLVLTAAGSSRGCPDADAVITNQKNLPIAIRTADCVPIFIYDPIHQVIGLAHAGWKGTHLQIAVKALQQMEDKYSSKCYDLKVVLGPSIRSCCYQVGEEFKEYFPKDIVHRNEKLYADVVGNNKKQFLKAGVREENITDSGLCTHCSPDYFSFRREGAKAGRMISLMMLI